MTRFEKFTHDRMAELTSARRNELKKVLDAEEAKIEKMSEKYFSIIENGVASVMRRAYDAARKDGHVIDDEEAKEVASSITEHSKNILKRSISGLEMQYDNQSLSMVYVHGPVADARDALAKFDEEVSKAATRLVVYKQDLGMKPDAFEKMLAEAAEKINRR